MYERTVLLASRKTDMRHVRLFVHACGAYVVVYSQIGRRISKESRVRQSCLPACLACLSFGDWLSLSGLSKEKADFEEGRRRRQLFHRMRKTRFSKEKSFSSDACQQYDMHIIGQMLCAKSFSRIVYGRLGRIPIKSRLRKLRLNIIFCLFNLPYARTGE